MRDTEISNKEPAITNISPILQHQENSVQSNMSPTIESTPESSMHNDDEEEVTVGNKNVIWNHNMALKNHVQQIRLQDIQQNNHKSTDDHVRQLGDQYTQTRKQKTSRPYKREVKHENKYINIVHYANSDKYMLSSPMFEKSDTIQQFQKYASSDGNSLTGDHNISPKEDGKELGHKDGQKERSELQFQGRLEYTQNNVAKTLTHNHSISVKSLMVPHDLYVQEMSVQHNRTIEEPNSAGRRSALQSWNTDVHSKYEPSSKHPTEPSNYNFRYSTFYF
jgi:hypothetical protein